MKILLALPIAALLAAAGAAPAHAATGEFYFETDAGRHQVLLDPPSGRCIRFRELSPAVSNQTGSTARLYVGDHCEPEGQLFVVPPRGTWRKEIYSAHSVRFD
jgi:hypothetical protein